MGCLFSSEHRSLTHPNLRPESPEIIQPRSSSRRFHINSSSNHPSQNQNSDRNQDQIYCTRCKKNHRVYISGIGLSDLSIMRTSSDQQHSLAEYRYVEKIPSDSPDKIWKDPELAPHWVDARCKNGSWEVEFAACKDCIDETGTYAHKFEFRKGGWK